MKKQIWNKENLTVVYFATKYGLNTIKENVQSVCSKLDLSEGSFDMLGRMINFVTTGEGLDPEHRYKNLPNLVEELEKQSKNNIESKVCGILDSDVCLQRETSKYNQKIAERTTILNQELEDTFNKKVADMRKFRRLKKVS